MNEQTTPRTVEEAAREEAVRQAHALWPGTDAEGWSARLAYTPAFVAGAAWQAARMPGVEEVAEVLAAHARLRHRDLDDPWLVCSGCGVEIETDARAALDEFAEHQAEQVAALWGAP